MAMARIECGRYWANLMGIKARRAGVKSLYEAFAWAITPVFHSFENLLCLSDSPPLHQVSEARKIGYTMRTNGCSGTMEYL